MGIKVKMLGVITGALLMWAAVVSAQEVPEEAVLAEAGDVVINEVMWMGASDSADEWIELKNTTDWQVDLAGCEITGAGTGAGSVSLTGVIGARGYYLLAAKDINESDLSDAVIINQVTSVSPKIALTNNGEQLTLLCEETILDGTPVGKWPAGDPTTRKSMERNRDADDGMAVDSWHTSTVCGGELWDEGKTACGTPGAANSEPKVNSVPEANISGPNEGEVNEELEFTGEGSADADGDGLSYAWSCGNGQLGKEMEIICRYSEAGTYVVDLTVGDGTEEDEATWEVLIRKRTYSDDILINEIFPNPEGKDSGNEFVEIFNQSGEEIDLSGWRLEYGSTGHLINDKQISGKGYVTFEYTVKNSGDTIKLLSPDGEEKDKVEYGVVPEGWSYAREDDGNWRETTTVTRGGQNVFTDPEEEDEEEDEAEENEGNGSETKNKQQKGKVAAEKIKKVMLKDVRQEEKGEQVVVEGIVSVAPGTLSQRTMYLAGSGIQVYSYNGFPELIIGDKVKVVGEVAETAGETRIKVVHKGDVAKVGAGEKPVPHDIQTGEAGEETEGWLVKISGSVVSTSGNTFYVDDGSGEVKVYVNPNTGIKKPKMKKGMAVTVTGVVSETSSGFRVLPRVQEDVRVGAVAGLSSFPKAGGRDNGWLRNVLAATAALLVGLGLLAWGYAAGEPVWKLDKGGRLVPY